VLAKSFSPFQSRVASLPPQSAIFYVLFAVDAAGVPPQAPSKLAIIMSPTKPIACFLID
jgi:hypothetical protein